MKEYVIVDGIKFYETKQGYYLGNIGNKPVRLHRYIWEKYCFKIPDGYDVHHIDHNKANNRLENFELIESSLHHSEHMKEPSRIEQSKANLNNIVRPKAIEWHKSDVGREWHKKQYEISLRKSMINKVEKTCEVCGNTYEVSSSVAYRSRFCSNKCKSAYRRHSGKDDIDKVCSICGKHFKTNKYSPAATCSQYCENELRKN